MPGILPEVWEFMGEKARKQQTENYEAMLAEQRAERARLREAVGRATASGSGAGGSRAVSEPEPSGARGSNAASATGGRTGGRAASATGSTVKECRRVVELCCDDDSEIGNSRFRAGGHCELVRITKDDDLLTKRGMRKALQAVKHPGVLVMVSLPCTGGSNWQAINVAKHGDQCVKRHRRKFRALLRVASEVCAQADAYGGWIAFEPPRVIPIGVRQMCSSSARSFA